jgi:UDP-glucose 4-epimerase
MTKKRALVTGGAGFIGSNLVHELMKWDWTVDVVDDMSNGRLEFLDGLKFRTILAALVPQWERDHEPARAEGSLVVIEADIEDPRVLARVAAGKYDVVFHLAANPRVEYSVQCPAATTDINCTRSLSLIEAVQSSKSPVRFVFSSTCAVYGDAEELPTSEASPKAPLSPYGLQKGYVEDYISMAARLHGLDGVSLRYFNVYGPRQTADSAYATAITAWCQRTQEGAPLRSDGDGEQTRDLVFVHDVVRANILAATREEPFTGERFNIGSGRSVSNNQILARFHDKFSGLEVKHAPPRPGDVRHTRADLTAAKDGLGYVPRWSFDDGLAATWQWWGF